MTLRLTAAGWTVIALAAALAVAGRLLGYPDLMGAGVVLAAVVGGACLWVAAVNGPVAVERRLQPDRLTPGAPAHVVVTVANAGRRPRAATQAVDGLSGPGAVLAPTVATVGALRRGDRHVTEYPTPPLPRGVYAVGPLQLVARDPLGLARSTRATTGTTPLHVHPRLHALRRIDADAGPESGRARRRGGMELDRLERYVVGDDIRHVHWPTSLRTGSLMVRHTAVDQAADLLVVLDTAATAYGRAEIFEDAVEVAASVALASRAGSTAVRFQISGAPPVAVASRRGRRDLLDRLAEVWPSRAAPSSDGPGPSGGAWPGPGERSIVAVTGAGGATTAAPEALEALAGRFGGDPVTVLVVGDEVRVETGAPGRHPSRRVLAAPTAAELVRLWSRAAR